MSLGLKTLAALLLSLLVWRLTIGGAHINRETMARALRQQAIATAVVTTQRQACELDPTQWQQELGLSLDGAGPALRMFAYDATLVAKNPDAPKLETEFGDLIPIAEGVRLLARKGEAPRYLVAMPWRDGPCAIILVADRLERETKPLARAPLFMFLATMCMLLLMLVRLRRLVRVVTAWEANPSGLIPDSSARDEIGGLSRAFRSASIHASHHLTRALRSEEALRRHLADVAHDFRTPLTVLMDRIYRLRNAPGLTQEIGYLMQDAQYLANLMHSIEVAARMEAGSTALLQEPLDFCEIVDRVVARHQTIAVQRGVLLAHATPLSAPIDGDPLVVEQVVSNLVHNAITYTPAGGHVSVVVESRSEGGFVLRISDDGPGLDPETFESMFDRGVRGSDAAASHPLGKGLGLSIVRRAVAHHGWRLSHQALDPQGLQVSLWLDDEAKASVDSALGSEVTPSA